MVHCSLSACSSISMWTNLCKELAQFRCSRSTCSVTEIIVSFMTICFLFFGSCLGVILCFYTVFHCTNSHGLTMSEVTGRKALLANTGFCLNVGNLIPWNKIPDVQMLRVLPTPSRRVGSHFPKTTPDWRAFKRMLLMSAFAHTATFKLQLFSVYCKWYLADHCQVSSTPMVVAEF